MPNEQATMHCPGCGAQVLLTQKFCRSCGFGLEKVSEAVAEQLPSLELSSQKDKLKKRQQQIERLLMVAGAGAGGLVALSFLTGVIYLMAVGSMPIVPGAILLILLITAIVAGSLASYSERLKKTLANPESLRKRNLPEAESGSGFDDFNEPLTSVTERTTNLLETRLNTTNHRKEGGT